ncbi:hypothetical protein PoB_005928900 [Plakobranchus ocellatus]|uniref:Sulfatase N-terminal domain-containing protein n=1 Tax=Plakobranchus ocellatus TaxID=259542 RepID=A0AAV4CMT8_9GAST|nr:hypothetical protein PoB_005928900 [Plakobranchus ocellatus]
MRRRARGGRRRSSRKRREKDGGQGEGGGEAVGKEERKTEDKMVVRREKRRRKKTRSKSYTNYKVTLFLSLLVWAALVCLYFYGESYKVLRFVQKSITDTSSSTHHLSYSLALNVTRLKSLNSLPDNTTAGKVAKPPARVMATAPGVKQAPKARPYECIFPATDPFDPQLKSVLKVYPPLDCSKHTANIVYLENFVAKVNHSKLSLVLSDGYNFSHCRCKEIKRKDGSDKAFEYTWTSETFTESFGFQHWQENIMTECFDTRKRAISRSYFPLIRIKNETERFLKKNHQNYVTHNSPLETLSILVLGFKESPVDYYQRQTVIASERDKLMRGNNSNCAGDIQEVTQIHDYWLQMARTFGKDRTTPFFAFSFAVRITHDDCMLAYEGDDVYHKFLQDLVATDSLDNTVIVCFSDHGPRFGPIRLPSDQLWKKCSPLTLLAVERVYHVTNDQLQSLKAKTYRVTIKTTPGFGLFEGLVNYEPGDSGQVMGDIVRINLYRGQAECVQDPWMRQFCFCAK